MLSSRGTVAQQVEKLKKAKQKGTNVIRTFPPAEGTTCQGCNDNYVIDCPDGIKNPDGTSDHTGCRTCEGVGQIPCTVCHPSAPN